MSRGVDPPGVDVRVLHRSRLWRDCLVSAFEDLKAYRAVAVDHERSECFKVIGDSPPDVVLVDLKLPGRLAIDLTHHVLKDVGRGKVIALASADCHEELMECLAAGAQGCVLDDSSLSEVLRAVERVLQGQLYCAPVMVHSILQRFGTNACESIWRQRAKSVLLTPRELEVLELISQHCSNKQIAKRLSVSLYTVKNHVHNIVEKLHVQGRHEAVEYARQRCWLGHTRVR